MTMKTVYNLEDYVKYNKKDTFKIFYNILSKNPVYLEDIEDVIQHFYLAAHRFIGIEIICDYF